MTNLIKSATLALLDIIFPPKCPACEKILKPSERPLGFCRECRKKIIHIGREKNVCLKCGKRILEEDREFCHLCDGGSMEFDQAKSIYEYGGIIKETMYRFKYSNKRYYGKTFGQDAKRFYGRWLKIINPSLIIPVPMYRKKARERGYNQAEIFAKYLSQEMGIAVRSDILVRNKNTTALKTLSVVKRAKELEGVFECSVRFKNRPNVLVVDDIFTTGATVNAITKVLRGCGAGKVYCMFICNGRPM